MNLQICAKELLIFIFFIYAFPVVVCPSPPNAHIETILPGSSKQNTKTVSTDDLAETIYQNLIKRKLPAQEQVSVNKAVAEEVRQQIEKDAIYAAKRKGRVQKFLHRLKESSKRRKIIKELRHMNLI